MEISPIEKCKGGLFSSILCASGDVAVLRHLEDKRAAVDSDDDDADADDNQMEIGRAHV